LVASFKNGRFDMSRTFQEWCNELSICATAPLCDIEAGYHGPLSEALLDTWCGVRRSMLEAIADLMLQDGFPVSDVLDALRSALGFRQ